ncbi:TetR/AcrR family transcriptional regulator [Actinomadura opuntiae]|uniref:TetR/AcrR family transcriptional regulator n=1 Tax=Actinomadura sp. OS1-43 TaxID=604315 RepID=UPI00255AEA56|nr:TetR/AcrR family transcriptional regulator [Actinomadura sp. OS1-43]MDL4818603.1 TetR/AcrR family transcriptional regulator [Actinomadura sp. OS1-43]
MSRDDPEAREISEPLRDIAGRIFAEVGYDGTTTDLLVSAGADRREVAAAGGKSGLYRSVMEELIRRQRDALETALENAAPGLDCFRRFADAFLDFHLENPHATALWMHRLLHDAADFAELEYRYVAPVHQIMSDKSRGVTLPTDPEMQIATVAWCVVGFLNRGLFNADGSTSGAEDPAAVARFRKHLQHLVSLMNTPGRGTTA